MYLTNFHFYNPKKYLYNKTVKGLQGYGIGYRFSFNGKEKDNETYGEGNANDFGARIYDSRLGRWISVDPLQAKYVDWSTYNFSMNSPISLMDPDGKRVYFAAGAGDDQSGWNYTTRFSAIMNAKGIDFRPIHATHGSLGDIYFTVSKSNFSKERSARENGSLEIQFTRVSDKMIAKAVADIKADLAKNPLKEGEELNLAGYSYGSVLMSHVTLKLSDEGIKVSNLVLVGSPISSESELFKSLSKVTNVTREDIPGDKLSNPKQGTLLIDGARQNSDPEKIGEGPHYDLARRDNPKTKNVDEGKVANQKIGKLANKMAKKGIK